MTRSQHDAAVSAMAAIRRDIEGRKGLGDEWAQIAEDIQHEIELKWVELIMQNCGAA